MAGQFLTVYVGVLLALGSASCSPLNGLTYLGRGAPDSFNESTYFTGSRQMTWRDAFILCSNTFPGEGTLVDIESSEELAHLYYLLEQNVGNEFTNFWTNAFYDYDSGDRLFKWSEGQPFDLWVPWAEEEPSRRDELTRVFFQKVEDEKDDEWEMYSRIDTSLHGLVCEVRPRNNTGNETSTPPPECRGTNDLVIVLESSDIVTETYFNQVKRDLIIPTVAAWTQYAYNKVAFILNKSWTDCQVETIFDLKNTDGDFQRAQKITNTPFVPLDASLSYCPLITAGAEFESNGSVQGRKQLVYLTTGQFADPDRTQIENRARELRGKGVKILAMGIHPGRQVGEDDLKSLTGDNAGTFNPVVDFAWLKNVLDVSQSPCNS